MTNTTANFIAVCLGILVLETTLVLAAVALLALRVSRAVRSVERVVLEVEAKVASIRTSWVQALSGLGGALGGFVSGRKHARARAEAEAAEAGFARR